MDHHYSRTSLEVFCDPSVFGEDKGALKLSQDETCSFG